VAVLVRIDQHNSCLMNNDSCLYLIYLHNTCRRNFVLSCIHVSLYNRDICDVFTIVACNVEQSTELWSNIIISVQGRPTIIIVLECVALRPIGLILNI